MYPTSTLRPGPVRPALSTSVGNGGSVDPEGDGAEGDLAIVRPGVDAEGDVLEARRPLARDLEVRALDGAADAPSLADEPVGRLEPLLLVALLELAEQIVDLVGERREGQD
jgi:hypothetical protein